MNSLRFNWANALALIVFAVIASAFQSTGWYQMLGFIPSPPLWISLALYLTLYRKPIEGIISIYVLFVFISPYTSMKLGVLWLLGLTIFAVMLFIKRRVFGPGIKYFFYASLGAHFLVQVAYILYSVFFEKVTTRIMFFHRIGEIIVGGIFSVGVFWLLTRIDGLTQKEFLPEAGGIEA